MPGLHSPHASFQGRLVGRVWHRIRDRLRRPTAGEFFTALSLLAMTGFVFTELHPGLLFKGTLTDGGDMGAHVYLPWYMRHYLIPEGRITGWSPGWYAGFPMFTFYFPLPSLFIALASFVIPYAVAFKLVTVSGIVIMPLCAWAMGRLAGWKSPVPIALAAATLPLLFERSFTIDGGNIASTMAGEYSFAISLSLGMVFLGLVARGLETGKHRGLAALVFAVVAMCHLLPAIFFGVFALLMILLQFGLKRIWWGVTVAAAGLAAAAVWFLPFVLRQGYATNMGWSKVTDYYKCLFPYSVTSTCTTTAHSEPFPFQWFVGFAALGAVISVARWLVDLRRRGWGAGGPHRLGVVLALGAGASAAMFTLAPSSGASSAVYNARAIPFWFLCIYLLNGVAVGEMATGIGHLWRCSRIGAMAANWWMGARSSSDEEGRKLPYPPKTWTPGALIGATVVTLLSLYYVALPLRLVHLTWLPGTVTVAQKSFVPDWVSWNYTGYQSRDTWPEYHNLMTTMGKVGKRYGCGRAMWEYDSTENNFGTPMALMLLPLWTNGCIDSMEGLLFESASSTPYHFINQSELSNSPSDAMRDIPYGGFNVPLGIQHLQLLGVRYFMSYSDGAQNQALHDPNVKLIAKSGPWSGAASFTGNSVTWDIFLVKGSNIVTPLANQPAEMMGNGAGLEGRPWLDSSLAWYTDPARWNVALTYGGPDNWQQVAVATSAAANQPDAVAGQNTTLGTATAIPLPAVRVSHVNMTSDSVSFDVSRTGVPVEVRESYFPNWQASGASGPYRATPNEMVVVPTAHHVVLHYGYTPIDILGWLLTLAGVTGAIVMWRRPPLAVPVPAVESVTGDGGGAGEAPGSGRLDPGSGTGERKPGALSAIFKAYDVRGTVPDQLDFDAARAIGTGFAIFLKLGGHLPGSNRILVARDMRESGIELSGGFVAGIRSQGVDVVDLGLASTDMVYFASGKLDSPAAVFTASHNPAKYNGIKFCLSGARPVGADTGLEEIRTIAEGVLGPDAKDRRGRGSDDSATRGDSLSGAGLPGVSELPPGSLTSMDMLDAFAAHVRSFVNVSGLHGMKVVADTANGMGGLVVPAVFSGIPVDLEILYPELDGSFPNHPADPIQVENLADLRARVLASGADVGLAFDGDADRVFLVDGRGEPLSGSLTTAMVARSMLAKHPRATILYNLICSKTVREVIKENGGVGVRTRVGHSFIKATMGETGAVFGGEHSGHYYFRDNYRADSGLIAALVVLEMVAESGKPLAELRIPFERYVSSGEINTEVEDPSAVIDAIEEHFAQVAPDAVTDRLDGLTVDLVDWWFNIRPSNTEPLLRLNLEARNRDECDAHVDEVMTIMKEDSRR